MHNIQLLLYPGAFVPLTREGNIVVDGILASCHASGHHDLANIGMKPVQTFPGIMNWIFGVDNGFSVYVKVSEYVDKWVQMVNTQ